MTAEAFHLHTFGRPPDVLKSFLFKNSYLLPFFHCKYQLPFKTRFTVLLEWSTPAKMFTVQSGDQVATSTRFYSNGHLTKSLAKHNNQHCTKYVIDITSPIKWIIRDYWCLNWVHLVIKMPNLENLEFYTCTLWDHNAKF